MAARAVFLGIRLAVEEIVVQAPRAKVVLMSLPPCEPPWATDSRWARLHAGKGCRAGMHGECNLSSISCMDSYNTCSATRKGKASCG